MKSSKRACGFQVVLASLAVLSLSGCASLTGTAGHGAQATSFLFFSQPKAPQERLRPYSADFLPSGSVIMAPTAFLEMCERSPVDCKHSHQTDVAAIAVTARTAILSELDKMLSGDSRSGESQTAAIDTSAQPPAVTASTVIDAEHVVSSYGAIKAPSEDVGAITSTVADSEDISGSDPAISVPFFPSADTSDLSDPSIPGAVSSGVPETLRWANKARPLIASTLHARVPASRTDWASSVTPVATPVPRVSQTVIHVKTDDLPRPDPNNYLRINFDAETRSLVRQTNDLVNQTIIPDTDAHIYKVADYWIAPGMAPGTRGDCEDYALEKRRLLIENGIPADSLSLAIVKTSYGEEHVVLILSTLQGDMVLDNLHYAIKPWRQTGYTWISRQSTLDDLSWVSLEEANGTTQISSIDASPGINQ